MTKLFSKTFGSGRDIILLHGWGMHSGIWHDLIQQLVKDGYRVTVIDLPGFGNSIAPIYEYRLNSIGRQILPIISKGTILVGWSMGGLIATWLATRYPTLIARLILVASSPCFLEAKGWHGIKTDVFEKLNASLKTDNLLKVMQRFLFLQLLSNYKKQILTLKKILLQKRLPKVHALQESLKLLQDTDLRRDLGALKCATLYILGELDPLVPCEISHLLPLYSTQIQVAIMPKSGHIPFLTHTQIFYDVLKNFCHE